MTATSALPCPQCHRPLEPHAWFDETSGQCRRCAAEFEFVALPALTAERTRVTAQAAEVQADSVCFFHAENRAEGICDECGRLLCPVCTVPFMGRKLCPACVAAAGQRADAAPVAVRDRVLFDSIALSIAVVPLLMFFVTLVTAPVALGFVVYAWNKPGSLVRGRGRWRLIVAAVFALAQIVGWTVFFTVRFRR